ncbi:unnamed protein product [Rotaria sp. Silwood2]|nr:unnamed protein product [Rotaria sp. Silwood2]CAF2478482.1 unnamed protein product [Rotaria sp. Silwood2]
MYLSKLLVLQRSISQLSYRLSTSHTFPNEDLLYTVKTTNGHIRSGLCSSSLIHLCANIKEYLNLPLLSAYIAVCIPNISMDIHINLIESLKFINDLNNEHVLEELNEEIHLFAAHSLGHFILDMSTDKIKPSSSHYLHSINFSPTTPWMLFC